MKRSSSPKSCAFVFKNRCKDSIPLRQTVTLLKIGRIAIYSNRISKFTECEQSCLLLAKHFVYKQLLLFTLILAKSDSHLLSLYNFKGFTGSNESKCNNRNTLARFPVCTLWCLGPQFPNSFFCGASPSNDLLWL